MVAMPETVAIAKLMNDLAMFQEFPNETLKIDFYFCSEGFFSLTSGRV